jgi:class 3 adenylate cyclase
VKSSEILSEVKSILSGAWQLNPARTVPDLERVGLKGNHGVQIEGTVLYADMADSTKLVDTYKSEFAAEIYKSFLLASCRVIAAEGGDITAFDGDRVMAVFVGDLKNTNAVKTAMKIHFMVKQINAAIVAQYPNSSFVLAHSIGIDTSNILVAKTGIRNHNDLVWVGSAANHAAKLAALNEAGYPTLITESVYKKLNASVKLGGTNKVDMWERRTWIATGKTIYRTNFWWTF